MHATAFLNAGNLSLAVRQIVGDRLTLFDARSVPGTGEQSPSLACSFRKNYPAARPFIADTIPSDADGECVQASARRIEFLVACDDELDVNGPPEIVAYCEAIAADNCEMADAAWLRIPEELQDAAKLASEVALLRRHHGGSLRPVQIGEG